MHLSLEDIDKGNKIILFVKFQKIKDIENEIEKLRLILKRFKKY